MKKLFLRFFKASFLVALLSFLLYFPYSLEAQNATTAPVSSTKVADGLVVPTDFVVAPDGRMFITEQTGSVKVFQNGAILPQPLIQLPVNTARERGLLGIVLDPQFSANHYFYLFYVFDQDPQDGDAVPPQIRVSRFTESNNSASLTSEQILLTSQDPLAEIHMGGSLAFGPDGKLYISVGNNELKPNSQNLSNIHGKILRINKDGSIPSDNPFGNSIWAYGLRNPFRISFTPDGSLFAGDVGDNSWEEINVIQKGGNYGYYFVEGSCNCQYKDPLYSYPHGSGAAVVGGFIYSGNALPQEFQGNYFYADYVNGFIKRLVLDQGNLVSSEPFLDNAGSVVQLRQGTDGSMYYLTLFGSDYSQPGSLYKVFSTQNDQPIVQASASPQTGLAPLSVNFSSNGTSEPQNRPLIYSWDFGDGQTSNQSNPTHTYSQNGIYKAKLTVTNGIQSAVSEEITIVVGGTYPTATITSPTSTAPKYNAGQTIDFSGTATDKEDGDLGDNAFSWTVVLHHGIHIHPYMSATTGKSGSFKINDTGHGDADTWYEVVLTVTDSTGLKTTVSQQIYPNIVSVTFKTNPAGLRFVLDGQPIESGTDGYTTNEVVGFKHTVDVESPQIKDDTSFEFESWSDGGLKTHQVVVPNQNTTLTANFKSLGQGTGNLKLRVAEFGENNTWLNNYLNDIRVKLTDTTGSVVVANGDKLTAKAPNGEDGWVEFNAVTPGTYGVMAYKIGYEGVWKKLNCASPQGTFQNASIDNRTSDQIKAAFNNSVTITGGKTTFCTDLGLRANSKGNLKVRVLKADITPTGYTVPGYIDGATVKLTDTTGLTVLSTQTSATRADGEQGWSSFDDIEGGNYGLMAYKSGFRGFLKKLTCNIEETNNATIQNNNTEGNLAAWNDDVTVVPGKTTYCYDLGLTDQTVTKNGNLRVRIGEFGNSSNWLNNYLNGVTVKLTNTTGSNVYQTLQSKTDFGSEKGWVEFTNITPGTYGLLAYQSGYDGTWKKLDCNDAAGSFNNATIQNNNTEGNIAAWNDTVMIKENQTTWCTDLGLKARKGDLAVRVAEFGENNSWLNKYLNDVTVKLTDQSGNTTIATLTTKNEFGTENGWALFSGITPGSYGVMAYKTGFDGVWKKIDCNTPQGDFNNVTIQNSNTTNLKAAFNNAVVVQSGQISWCKDLGLKSTTAQKGNIKLRIAEFSNNTYQGRFLNDVTVKLTDPSGTAVVTTKLSAKRVDGEDGWVEFDDINPGTYGVLAYKSGFDGIWKKLDCDSAQGDFNNATIQNNNTEGNIAAWNNNIILEGGQTIYCKDLGLQIAGTKDMAHPMAAPSPMIPKEASPSANSSKSKTAEDPFLKIDSKPEEEASGSSQEQ